MSTWKVVRGCQVFGGTLAGLALAFGDLPGAGQMLACCAGWQGVGHLLEAVADPDDA